jgi:SEC-C motif domain protein
MRKFIAPHQCPCESGHAYAQCCGLWHSGFSDSPKKHAPTPEALMRSRYSAYALQLGEYLLYTWHASTSPGELEFAPTKWLGLEVKATEHTGDVGVVEFVARYRDSSGKAGRIHEVSRFVREGAGQEGASGAARWLYIDGEPSEA